MQVLVDLYVPGALREALNLKDFGCAQDAVDAVLVQVGLAPVHEVQEDLEIIGPRPVKNDKELVVEGCIDLGCD